MSIRFSQLLAILFVMSLTISPQAAAFASDVTPPGDEATPIQNDNPADDAVPDEAVTVGDGQSDDADATNGESNDIVDPTEDVTDPSSEVEEIGESTPAAEPNGNLQTSQSADSAATSDAPEGELRPAAISGNFDISLDYVYPQSWIEIELSFDVGLSANAGDSMFLRWDTSRLDTEVVTVIDIELPVDWDFTDPNGATLEFRNDYVVPRDLRGIVRLHSEWASLPYNACVLSQDPYLNEAELQFSFGSSTADTRTGTLTVQGPECPGSPFVWGVGYVPRLNAVYATVRVPNNSVAGESVTITYPTQRIHLEAGEYNVYMYAGGPGTETVIGTAVVTEGTVIITFDDFPPVLTFAWVTLPATVVSEACVPGSGLDVINIDPITFIGIPGSVWTNNFEQMLCNAAPMTKVGKWVSDTEIEWTIDTGDLYGVATIGDSALDLRFAFNCADGDVTVEYLPGYEVPADDPHVICSSDFLTVRLLGNSIQRAEITFRTTIDVASPATSYVNCAYSEVNRGSVSESLSHAPTVETAGLGGSACYELFPTGGGDFLSKTVDKAEVESGGTVTFTVSVFTSSDEWLSVVLRDVLPGEFEIDEASISCSVLPLDYQAVPCFTHAGNELVVHVLPLPDGATGLSAPVNITLSFSGTVTGEPGDIIENKACSERIAPDYGLVPMAVSGDPTILGGGMICETAETRIVAPPDPNPLPSSTATQTPTGTPTETPGAGETPTPPATPGATPTSTATADPDPTRAVTGLPSTGSGDTGASALFVMAIAASLLVASAVGIRLRPRE